MSREFYKDYQHGLPRAVEARRRRRDWSVNQSHGGSSKQARAVIDGLEADVVTMNQAQRHRHPGARGGMVPADWAKRFPDNAAPTTSVTVILVRKGNPKGIKDWADLARPGVGGGHPQPQDSPATAATPTWRPGARC